MFYKSSLVAAAAIALSSLSANATVVDLSSLAGTSGSSLSVPELTITSDTPGVEIVVDPAPPGGTIAFCALVPGVSCANDFTISFAAPSTGVSIGLIDASPQTATTGSDKVTFSVLDAAMTVLGSTTVSTFDIWGASSPPVGEAPRAGTINDFLRLNNVSFLVIDDESDLETGGFGYFDITAAPSPVPVPAGMWFMVAGIGALGLARRRRQKKP